MWKKSKEYEKHLLGHIQTHTHIYICLSLALVGQLFTMIVDPRRSSDESRQEANHTAQAAGNRPNLEEVRQVSLVIKVRLNTSLLLGPIERTLTIRHLLFHPREHVRLILMFSQFKEKLLKLLKEKKKQHYLDLCPDYRLLLIFISSSHFMKRSLHSYNFNHFCQKNLNN